MSKNIVYVGTSQVRQITAADWTSLGIVGEPTRRWEQSNSFEQLVSDTAAAYLLAQTGEFVDENDLTFPGIVEEADKATKKDDTIHGREFSEPMRGWNAGISNSEGGSLFSAASGVVVGDSITRLGGFSGVATTLHNLFNVYVGDGPTTYYSVRGTFPWDTVQGAEVLLRGLCGIVDELGVGQYDEKLAVKGNHYSFFWSAGAPGSQLQLRVGGVLVQTVDASVRGTYFYDAGTYAARDIRMTCVTNPGARADGVLAYTRNNYLQGCIFQTWGHSGSSTADKIANPDIIAQLTANQPNVIIVATGINDGGSADPDAYYDNMTTWIETLKAACPLSSICLWIPPETGGHSPWDEVHEFAHQICREQNVVPICAFEVLGQWSGADPNNTDDPYDFTNDGVHFTAKAQRINARLTTSVLLGDYFRSQAETHETVSRVRSGHVYAGQPFGEAEETLAKKTYVFHRSVVGLEYLAVMAPDQSAYRDVAVKSDPANGQYAANRAYVDKRRDVDKAASRGVAAGGSEAGVTYRYTGAGAAVFTLPVHATSPFENGTVLEVWRHGAGAVTFAANGNTLNVRGGLTGVIQHGVVRFTKVGNAEWTATGDLV